MTDLPPEQRHGQLDQSVGKLYASPYPTRGYPVPEDLDALQQHFIDLYGARNNIWLPGREPRISLLSVGIGDLQDAIRKDAEVPHLEAMFARIPARIFCIANGINNVSVSTAMREKYPPKCSYCQSNPCHCSERRSEPVLDNPMNYLNNRNWGLREWQSHLDHMYGDKNRERGIDNVMNRLGKEVSELITIEYHIQRSDDRLDIEHEYALELADCMAWTIAAANVKNIDLERVTMERFWPHCQVCKQKPCKCGNFNFKQVNTK